MASMGVLVAEVVEQEEVNTEVIFDLPDADISKPPVWVDWCEEILNKDWGYEWDDLPDAPEFEKKN
jgi:hypothetical protein